MICPQIGKGDVVSLRCGHAQGWSILPAIYCAVLNTFVFSKYRNLGKLRPVPYAESDEAVAQLITARTRLTNITQQLNEAKAATGQAAQAHCVILQREWDEALRAFQLAAEAFSTAVKKVHDEVETLNRGGT